MSTILREIMKQQGLIAKTNYSAEELEELEVEASEEVEELVEVEADEIDAEFEEVEQVEEAATSLEAMADFIDAELTGLSQEGYAHLMEAGNAVLSTARIYNQEMMSFSAEDGEAESKEARKESATSKFREKAGSLKDAAIEAIKRLFAAIKKFFADFFDRIAKVKKVAAAKKAAIDVNGKVMMPKAWAEGIKGLKQLVVANNTIGKAATNAIKHMREGGNGVEAYQKLSAIESISLPAALIGAPKFADHKLQYTLPEKGEAVEVSGRDAQAALTFVVDICAEIENQRKELKGSVLSKDEKAAFKIAQSDSGEAFSKALKLINGVYKSWVAYTGKVCLGMVGSMKPAKAAE